MKCKKKDFPWKAVSEYWKTTAKKRDFKNYIELKFGEIVAKYWEKNKICDSALSLLFASTVKF